MHGDAHAGDELVSYFEILIFRSPAMREHSGTLTGVKRVSGTMISLRRKSVGHWIAQTIGFNIYGTKEDAIFSSVEVNR